jgi:hypothetical protein|tara:strand:+ start:102 stop:389 length:288 start_codon:yes stop_codon:yes gene_type:complete
MRGSKLSKKNRRAKKANGTIKYIQIPKKDLRMGGAGMLGNIGGGAVVKGASLLKQGIKNFGKSKLIQKGLEVLDKKVKNLGSKYRKKKNRKSVGR